MPDIARHQRRIPPRHPIRRQTCNNVTPDRRLIVRQVRGRVRAPSLRFRSKGDDLQRGARWSATGSHKFTPSQDLCRYSQVRSTRRFCIRCPFF
jgi:hypothetical protein